MWKTNIKHIMYTKKVNKKIAQIIKTVGDDYYRKHKELLQVKGINIKYLPDPFVVAEYYGIKIVYKKIEGEMPSYFHRKKKTIFISYEYYDDNYISKKIVAHELGHFFLDSKPLAALNNDILNKSLVNEKMSEYWANVFAVTLMPQIMGAEPWREYSPDILNRKVFNKLLERQ